MTLAQPSRMSVYELGACPVCGTSEFRQIADEHEIKREVERLWAFHAKRLRQGAPVQQLFDRAVFTLDPVLLSDVGYDHIAVHGDTLVATAGPWTRRWATWEERITKQLMRTALSAGVSPWLEVYARRC